MKPDEDGEGRGAAPSWVDGSQTAAWADGVSGTQTVRVTTVWLPDPVGRDIGHTGKDRVPPEPSASS